MSHFYTQLTFAALEISTKSAALPGEHLVDILKRFFLDIFLQAMEAHWFQHCRPRTWSMATRKPKEISESKHSNL